MSYLSIRLSVHPQVVFRLAPWVETSSHTSTKRACSQLHVPPSITQTLCFPDPDLHKRQGSKASFYCNRYCIERPKIQFSRLVAVAARDSTLRRLKIQ